MSLTPVTLLDRLVEAGTGEAGRGTRGAERSRSLEWLRSNGLPTSRDEAWKYTPLKDLLARPLDRLATAEDGTATDASLESVPVLDGEIRVVLVDGILRPDLSGEPREGLSICALDSPDATEVPQLLLDPTGEKRLDGFQMLNRGFGTSGVLISAAVGAAIEAPVHVVHLSSGSSDALLVQPKVEILAGQNSQLTVVESFLGTSTASFVNSLTSVVAETDALVRHYKIQAQALGSVHLSSSVVRQESGSTFQAGSFSFGGSISRSSIDVIAAGDRTSTDMFGLYLPNGSQRMDNVITVEHAGRHGASDQTYKGVIDDRARGSFSGHIIVDHGTVGTEAHQNNKTLLLDPVAQSDSRPWLEIFADDVICTHGSAIGQLDAESLFYLRSRGIPFDDARAILVGGFINEVIDKVALESVREEVIGLVREQVRSGFTAELGGEH